MVLAAGRASASSSPNGIDLDASITSSTLGAEPTLEWDAANGEFRVIGPHVTISGSRRIDLDALSSTAEDAFASARAWLGLPRATEADALQVRLVDDVEDLFAIEAEHGLPSSREFFRARTFRGRCYPSAGLIVLPDSTEIGLRWQIVHEIAHVVVASRVGACPTVLDEGLAELVPYWILGSDRATPETLDCEYELYDRRLAAAALTRELPTFERLLAIDDATFHDPTNRWLWYAASWKLAKVMVESVDPRIRGRLPAVLDAVAAGRDLRRAVNDAYSDSSALEVEWRRAIQSVAAWRPMFGDWRFAGAPGDVDDVTTLIGRASSGTSSCATFARRRLPAEAFEMAFTLASEPSSETGFGFVFDARAETDFVYVEVRPGGRGVVVAERENGTWIRATEHAIESKERLLSIEPDAARRFALSVDSRGLVRLLVDGRVVARHELERAPAGGDAGFMLENCASSADVSSAAGTSASASSTITATTAATATTSNAPRELRFERVFASR